MIGAIKTFAQPAPRSFLILYISGIAYKSTFPALAFIDCIRDIARIPACTAVIDGMIDIVAPTSAFFIAFPAFANAAFTALIHLTDGITARNTGFHTGIIKQFKIQ